MDEDLPHRQNDVLSALARQPLDPLSGHELEHRLSVLRSEILRTEVHMAAASNTRDIAEALFRKSEQG